MEQLRKASNDFLTSSLFMKYDYFHALSYDSRLEQLIFQYVNISRYWRDKVNKDNFMLKSLQHKV